MRKIILISIFLLAPIYASAAGDIVLNNQSTYAVPLGATKVLILDLTLPENLNSIKIWNLGDAQQWDISAMYFLEDGSSPGLDGDEKEIARKISSPFWDTEISVSSAELRVFVTADIASGAASGKTIKPKALINSDKTIIGFERIILAGASAPLVPAAPFAQSGQALSSSAIRWNFSDLANNEFGFRIKDSSLKIVASSEQANLSYLDETGLEPGTCYSGRRASAINDRGEGFASSNFAEVCTLAAPAPAEVPLPELPETPGVDEETPPVIQEDLNIIVRQKIIEILAQIIQLLQQKLVLLQANLSQILRWLFWK